MDRITPYLPLAGVVVGGLFACHLGMMILPATIDGLSTPILLLGGLGASIAAGLRWL